MKTLQAQLKHNRRKWKIVGVMVLIGLISSGILNVMHAPKEGGWVAQLIGGIPPVALLVCLEMISGIPVASRSGKWIRYISAGSVALLAFYVSFRHQLSFIEGVGYRGDDTAWAIPLIIDGWMVVASVSLFEVTGKIRTLREEILMAETAAEESAKVAATPAGATIPQANGSPARKSTRRPGRTGRPKQPPNTALKAAVKTIDEKPAPVTAEVPMSVGVVMDEAPVTA